LKNKAKSKYCLFFAHTNNTQNWGEIPANTNNKAENRILFDTPTNWSKKQAAKHKQNPEIDIRPKVRGVNHLMCASSLKCISQVVHSPNLLNMVNMLDFTKNHWGAFKTHTLDGGLFGL